MIGEVTDHGDLRVFHDGELVGSIPAALLTDECPRYEVEQRPAPSSRPPSTRSTTSPRRGCSSSTTSSSARAPCAGPGSTPPCCGSTGRAASPSRSTARRSAVATRSRAGYGAVFDAALNVACAGGEPLALTDCLNFGNPEKPEIGWELAQAIDGIAQAANELGIPVVLRERLALQRDRRPPDPADAGRRLRRPRPRRDVRSRRAGGAATASSCSAARAPSSCASSGRTPTAGRSPTTSPTAGSRSRSARPPSGRALGPRATVGTWRRRRDRRVRRAARTGPTWSSSGVG